MGELETIFTQIAKMDLEECQKQFSLAVRRGLSEVDDPEKRRAIFGAYETRLKKLGVRL